MQKAFSLYIILPLRIPYSLEMGFFFLFFFPALAAVHSLIVIALLFNAAKIQLFYYLTAQNFFAKKKSFTNSCRDKTSALVLEFLAELRPHNLVGSVRKVCGFLRQHSRGLALAALVFLQFAVHVLYFGVVPGNQGEAALVAVEPCQGEVFALLAQNQAPKQVFVRLGRFHPFVGVLDDLPAGFFEIGDGELVVAHGVEHVGVA